MTDYEKAGVGFDRAAAAKARISTAARSTFGPRVLTDVGHFGGFFALDESPQGTVLVASTDGVGTKVLLGHQLGRLGDLGRDLVHHSINDILMCGATPLFFLDYMAFGRISPEIAGTLAESFAGACREHGVALLGGETAEMPDLYAPEHFDLAGTIVGIVRRDRMIDGTRVKPGDVLLGLASSGLHTNGYSLVRTVLAKEISTGQLDNLTLADGRSVADALLAPHRCYLPSLRQILDDPSLHALSHVTGGGLEENTYRVVPKGLRLNVNWSAWERPEIFKLIQQYGNIAESEMRRVFNLGIGAIAVVESNNAARLSRVLSENGEMVFTIGTVTQ
jgi:phosphoribosylformylglycinamidine cyclo-ligase